MDVSKYMGKSVVPVTRDVQHIRFKIRKVPKARYHYGVVVRSFVVTTCGAQWLEGEREERWKSSEEILKLDYGVCRIVER